MDSSSEKRTYDNRRRREAAAATRLAILEAARSILESGGYAEMTVASLARAAGVSPQTIYNSVGDKSAVVKACYDVVLAGDDAAVPMSRRPAFQALTRTSSSREFHRAYAHWCRDIYSHVGRLLGALVGSGVGDESLRQFLATIDEERRIGASHAIARLEHSHGLPEGANVERAVDIVWTLNSPEIFDRLVNRCGWSLDEYEEWLAGQLTAAL